MRSPAHAGAAASLPRGLRLAFATLVGAGALALPPAPATAAGPPAVALTAPTASHVRGGGIELTATATDPDGIKDVTFRVTHQSSSKVVHEETVVGKFPRSTWTASDAIANGTYLITVRAVDTTATAAEATHTVVYDSQSPKVLVYGPELPPGFSTLTNDTFVRPGETAPLTIQATDQAGGAVASLRCRFDLEAYAPCSADFAIPTTLPEGDHTFTAEATDLAGNTASHSRTVHVDGTPPLFVWSASPEDGATVELGKPAMWLYYRGEQHLIVECRVLRAGEPEPGWQVGGPGACGGSYAFSSSTLGVGSYVVEVRAADLAWNRSPVIRKRFTVVAPAAPPTMAQPVPPVGFRFSYEFRAGRTGWFTKLRVTELSAGAKLTALCRGPGCPKQPLKLRSKQGRWSVPKLIGRGLRRGAQLELVGARPGAVGRVVRFTVRGAGKLPKVDELCLAPGAKQARRCAKGAGA